MCNIENNTIQNASFALSHENVIGFPTSLTLQWTAYKIWSGNCFVLVYFGKTLHCDLMVLVSGI